MNAFGDWRSTTGLAEAGRRLARALVRRGVTLSCSTVRTGAPTDDTLWPTDLAALTGPPTWPIDLWTLNINEFAMLGEAAVNELGGSRYRIATWYWELSTTPRSLWGAFDQVDEIWVPSSFVRRSFLRYTRTPIHIVPTVVPVSSVGRIGTDVRCRLGHLPGRRIFLFTFDFNSSTPERTRSVSSRLSPKPFQGDDHAVLVIKTMNLDQSPTFEADIRQALRRVNGVLISEFLSQQDLGGPLSCL